MSVSLSNPAGRVYTILKAAGKGDQNTRMLEVWSSVLGGGISEFEVVKGLTALAEALAEIEVLIRSDSSLNHERYLACIAPIRNTISPLYLQSTRQQVVSSHITPEVLTRLEFCDEVLRKQEVEELLSEDDLSQIARSASELFDMIKASVKDYELRVMLLEAIENVRIYISQYRIYGIKGIKSGVQRLVGVVVTDMDAIKKEKAQNSDSIQRLVEFLTQAETVISKARKIYKAVKNPIGTLVGFLRAPAVPEERTEGREDGVIDV